MKVLRLPVKLFFPLTVVPADAEWKTQRPGRDDLDALLHEAVILPCPSGKPEQHCSSSCPQDPCLSRLAQIQLANSFLTVHTADAELEDAAASQR